MKIAATIALGFALTSMTMADAPRVAVLDFADETGQAADARLGGTIRTEALASKGVIALNKALVKDAGYVLLDRRDFIRQIENTVRSDDEAASDAKPSFLHAAQALKADVVLRGSLQSFSTGTRKISAGGHTTELVQMRLRVALEALDAIDGTVIGVAEGSNDRKVRQTAVDMTEVGEDEVLDMLGAAVANAVPELKQALEAYEKRKAARPSIRLDVETTEGPALIEIDGVLVGSSPLSGHQLYKGDHILSITRPGYRAITKRINFEADTKITVPMLRVELSAEEIKDALDNARVNAYLGIEPALVVETIERVVE